MEENREQLLVRMQKQEHINGELKKLYRKMKDKIRQFQKSNESFKSQDQIDLQKKLRNAQIEVEHKIHLLNILIQSNNKLKTEVNCQRNARVIYSNIYKQLEKNIQKKQHQYKVQLIQGLLLEASQSIINQNITKGVNKWTKKINKLTQQLECLIDTALETKEQPIKTEKDLKLPFTKTNTTIHMKARRTGKVKMASDQNDEKQAKQNEAFNQLKKLSNFNSVQEIVKIYGQLDHENENKYNEYLILQEKISLIQDNIEILKKNLLRFQQSTEQVEQVKGEQELTKLKENLQIEKKELKELQEKASKILDINIQNLTQEEIDFHFHRIKQKKANKSIRNLEKMLEKASKKKSQETYILTQQQMQKSFLQNLR